MNKKKYSIFVIAGLIALTAVIIPLTNNINAERNDIIPDYLGQAQKVFDEMQRLDADIEEIKSTENVETNATIQEKQDQIVNLENDLKYLEDANKALYQLDAISEQKLRNAEQVLFNEYYKNIPFEINPIVTAGANLKSNQLDIFIDTIKLEKLGQTQAELENAILSVLKNSDVKVVFSYSEYKDISCSSKTADCDPLISGISVEEDGFSTENTMSYKATKGSDSGFIMAAHSANDDNAADIVQAHDSTRVVGNIDAMNTGNCDCAFAHADQGISVDAEIWKNSSSNYDIVGKEDDVDQDEGTWVYKVGVGTGISLGQIDNNSSVVGFATLVQIYHSGGDSGSTVFTKSGDDATVYGMLIGSYNSTHAVYQPQDFIEDKLVVTTSTS